jgi:hypothetical protein
MDIARYKKLSPSLLDPLITVELYLSGFIGTENYPDIQKIWIIEFFFGKRLEWQFAVRLLLFTVCT